ncbi:MAG: hypothetical protein ACRCTZ_02840 [Sarcina sp.]
MLHLKIAFKKYINNLYWIFMYFLLTLLFIVTSLFLDFNKIKGLTFLLTIGILILIFINIFTALQNRKPPKKLFLILNVIVILFLVIYPFFTKNYYKNKDVNLKFLHVFLNQKTMDYLNEFDKYEYKNVIIYHDNLDKVTLDNIERCIDKAVSKTSDIYTNLTHEKLNFILHPTLDKYLLSNDGKFADGYFNTFDKTLNMPLLETSVIDETFEEVFVHEYNHYLLDKLRMDNDVNINALPGWFDEGVSEFFTHGNDFSDMLFEFIDYNSLDSYDEWNQTLSKGYNPYAQSHYTICYLIQKTSIETIEKIVIGSKKIGFEESFEKEVKIPLDTFLTECENALVKKFSVEKITITD